MGYRGKVVERQQARRLRRTGLPLGEIATRVGVSKSSVSVWVRDVEFDGPLVRAVRGRRRDPNALQRRSRVRSSGSWRRAGSGSGACRSGSSWSPGSRCTRGRSKRDGSVVFANSDPPHDRVLLLLAQALLPGRRVAPEGPPLSPSGARSDGRDRLLVGVDEDPAVSVCEAVPGVPDPSIRNTKHVHGCVGVRYSCSATHRSIMGLVGALLGGAVIPG
jgi:hypothetical protein